MRLKIVYLYILKFTILLLSLGTLGCHVAQLVLLNQLSDKTGSWWPHYVPYILYYAGTISSVLSSTVLLFLNCMLLLPKLLWYDCLISIINMLLFVSIIIYISLKSGVIPWTGNIEKQFSSTTKGYVTYCSNYDDDNMLIRCWLSNGEWLGIVIIGFFWLLLSAYSILFKKCLIIEDEYYDFKNDIPMTKPEILTSTQRLNSLPPVMATTKTELISYPPYQDQRDNYYHNTSEITTPTQQQSVTHDVAYEYNLNDDLYPITKHQYVNNIPHQTLYEMNMPRRMSKTFIDDEDEPIQQQKSDLIHDRTVISSSYSQQQY
ncbi:uncharacterized protein BX663DRAFT_539408 [Cokeromyces recurvatus]|uniref:uncharacterized protein n=1 Tax=Cokeromyces recurvatus TaxID=90255 RepID=UPI00221F07B3|nr:uncharacterized protein BX663DRAFT_539408 [Cokeromyces recurvatus]KAI7908039.1 hypothetical protein BX663DRAFT_539408 [Cokeromyces recurvatus]